MSKDGKLLKVNCSPGLLFCNYFYTWNHFVLLYKKFMQGYGNVFGVSDRATFKNIHINRDILSSAKNSIVLLLKVMD